MLAMAKKSRFIAPPELLTEATMARVLLLVASFCWLVCVKSPKSDELPVDAIVIKSIVFAPWCT